VKPLVASHIESIQPYVPGKPVEQLERELGITGAVKLASNENPLGASPHVLEAIRAAASGVHRYPDDDAHELRQRLSAFHQVAPNEIGFGHGSNELIDLTVRTFATSAEHAVVGVPSFSCYSLSLAAANIPTTSVPLRDGLFWDLDAVRAALRPETKLVFLDNPGNPTSTHIPGAALRTFLSELPADIIAVVDEAYIDYATAADYVSAMTMRGLRERLMILRTFSKAYGLAALRLGYAIAPAELIAYMLRVRVPFSASTLAQVAAVAALADRAHLQRGMDLNASERARMTAALEKLGLTVAPSQTNFVCVFVDRPATQVYQALLRSGVIVRPFGPPLHRHLRISVGLPAENDRFLAVLPEVLAQIPRGTSV
jgi:histidinol-phosphate aminotransferase